MTQLRGDGHVHLADYRAPAWRIPQADLEFELNSAATIVAARLCLSPDPAQPGQPLELDGEGLELLDITLDGQPLPAERYDYDGHRLVVRGLSGDCELATRVRIRPAEIRRHKWP